MAILNWRRSKRLGDDPEQDCRIGLVVRYAGIPTDAADATGPRRRNVDLFEIKLAEPLSTSHLFIAPADVSFSIAAALCRPDAARGSTCAIPLGDTALMMRAFRRQDAYG
jgi:hypothetical protein